MEAQAKPSLSLSQAASPTEPSLECGHPACAPGSVKASWSLPLPLECAPGSGLASRLLGRLAR